jgi:hypothetical protein
VYVTRASYQTDRQRYFVTSHAFFLLLDLATILTGVSRQLYLVVVVVFN